MNERIEKLAEQAREYATTRHPVSNTTLSVNSDLFEQKFAELIVRECAQVCRDQPNHYALKTDRDNCAVAIKEHFGVE
jgi:protein gp37